MTVVVNDLGWDDTPQQGTLFELPTEEDPGSVALQEIIDKYELVAAESGENPYIIVSERGESTQLVETVAVGPELASSSPSPWTSWTREEHNPKLRDKFGINEYYKMKRIDGIIRGALRVYKTPVLGAHWFVEPASDSTRDKNVAEFVHENLFSGEHLNVSFGRILEDILLMIDYGHMIMEKVYKLDSDGKVRLRKLAPRHPSDVREWLWDSHGGPDGVVMEPPEMGNPADDSQGVFIAIKKLAIFSHEPEAGDLRGTSVLRSAYMHFTFKQALYKIDAIQKERHGIGVPVVKLPPGFTKEDKRIAENLGRNLRTNERAHVTLPPSWELIFAELEGQPVDCMKSVEHHNNMILANVLAPFLTAANTKKEALETFYKATRYVAELITDTINQHVIPDLVNLNYSRVKLPKLRARRIGEWEDARTQSFTLRNYVGAGLLTPDERLEVFLRAENDLPPIDFETRKEVEAPQAPGDPAQGEAGGEPNKPKPPTAAPAKGPRQASPSANPPRSNAGKDKSGGS